MGKQKQNCEKKCDVVKCDNSEKVDNCNKKRTAIVPEQPLTLIQNVSQPVDADGEFIKFQKFNNTKFAKLLSDMYSIKIRKTGTYILTLSGTIQWVSVNGTTLSFALLKNGVPLTETIQNQTIPAGIFKFDETLSRSFSFKRGDILTFEAESSVPATTFVPSIVVGLDTVYGNGLTLTLQSLQGQSVPVISIDPTRYVVFTAILNGERGIWVNDSITNIATFCYIENTDTVSNFIVDNAAIGNPVYVVGWAGQSTDIGDNDYYVRELYTQAGVQALNIICRPPYSLASQVFGETF